MKSFLPAPRGEVIIVDHADCVPTPFEVHVAHLPELFLNSVKLEDAVLMINTISRAPYN